MISNKKGFMLLELIVAITISAIIMGSLSGFLPNMMMKNKIISEHNISTKRQMVDYLLIMKDLRNAELNSKLGVDRMRLFIQGDIVEYKIEDEHITRRQSENTYKTVFKGIKIYSCNKVVACDGWESVNKNWWIKSASWWKIELIKGKYAVSGILRGG